MLVKLKPLFPIVDYYGLWSNENNSFEKLNKSWGRCTLRENRNFPSVKGFPESQKSSTRGSQSFPSVALREEMHSGKRDFPESPNQPDTRGRITLGKIHLPRAQHSGKSRSRGRKVFHDVPTKRRRWSLK